MLKCLGAGQAVVLRVHATQLVAIGLGASAIGCALGYLAQAALSRLSPVVLAAATTVLGVMPLLPDLFWVGLAVAIMGGLSFGTLLTMIMVPVFYSTLYGLRAPSKAAKAAPSKVQAGSA